MTKPVYTKLTPREHILHRPNMYIGDIKAKLQELYVFDSEDNAIISKNIISSDGLLRIYLEVLYNAVDNQVRSASSFKDEDKTSYIKITFDKETGRITVKNDGLVIPIEIHEKEGIYNHNLIFGHLQTSSNYDDTQGREGQSGQNGFGVKLTNIFSKEFTVTGVDTEVSKIYTQTWTDHMSVESKPSVKTSKLKNGYTEVSFIPDYAFFGFSNLTDDLISLFSRYIVDTAMIVKNECKIYINNQLIPVHSLVDYAKLFMKVIENEQDDDSKSIISVKSNSTTSSTSSIASSTLKAENQFMNIKTENSEIVLIPSQTKEFKYMSFVNGLYTNLGGVHLDAWCETLFRPIVDKLNGKKEKEKPVLTIREVKNFFMLFVVCNVKQPKFTDQSKNKLVDPTPTTELKPKQKSELLKWPVLKEIQNIIFQKELSSLKKTERKRGSNIIIKNLEKAYHEGTSRAKDCTLIFVEGDSAKTYVVSGLQTLSEDQKKYYGIYKLRGKLLNTRNATIANITKNAVIQDIVNALGLKYNVDYSKDENFKSLRYGRIMIITDADEDGFHICGLIHNVFDTLFPTLYQRKVPFVQSMYTPIARIILKNKKDIIFYDLQEFEKYKRENPNQKFETKYYKGLASSSNKEAKETYGRKTVEYIYDEEAKTNMMKAFHKDLTNQRKSWVGEYNIERIPVEWHGDQIERQTLSLTSFIDNELIKFSRADCARSIPNLIDGFKECQRKVLYTAFKTNLDYKSKLIKVAQFAAQVANISEYHHGEQNLSGAITKMAQNFAGSNNIPILYRGGQFGSRRNNGADAGQPRYIHTKLDMCTKYIFREEDLNILEYKLGDESTPIEPKYYVPIIPMILVNGSQGIGTGWSTTIPCFNPIDIINNVRNWINDKELTKLIPYYNGFTGKIVQNDDKDKFQIYGKLQIAADNSYYKVIELPISTSIDSFKEFLDDLLEAKEIRDYHNGSNENEPNFTIFPAESELTFKSLKLISSISTTNMVAFDKDNCIRDYADTNMIIQEFCGVRLQYYITRKKYLLKNYDYEIRKLKNKVRFLEAIITGELELTENKIPKEIDKLTLELEENKYEMFDDDYSYLLNITIRGMTKSNIDKIKSELEKRENEYNILLNKTEREIWLEELLELENIYKEYLKVFSEESSVKVKQTKGSK